MSISPSSLVVQLNKHLDDGHITYEALYKILDDKRLRAAKRAWTSQHENAAGKPGESNSVAAPDAAPSSVKVARSLDPQILLLWGSGGKQVGRANLAERRSNLFAETYPDDFKTISGESLLVEYEKGFYYMICTPALLARNPDLVLSENCPWQCALFTRQQFSQFSEMRKADAQNDK